ncbi:MAG: pentapeptide repeat-containing protein [Cyanobacteria bacterium P01_H01_bin.58]
MGANLSEAHASSVKFQEADRTAAVLRASQLEWANFWNAILMNADLRSAALYGANLEFANLSNANLQDVDLRDANLENAQLDGVRLEGCQVRGALFTDATGLSGEQKQWLKRNGALNVGR